METNFFMEFYQNRKKFVLELMFWLGALFLFGFIRSNVFGNVGSYTAPVYTVYGVWGNELESGTDVCAAVRNNAGKGKEKPEE